jgi:bifunctional non-homologous end joining protein LigD
LLRGRPDGILNPFESGAIGPDLFRAACDIDLEGLVSKRSDRPFRGGRPPHWIKVKNRQHQAMTGSQGCARCQSQKDTHWGKRKLKRDEW